MSEIGTSVLGLMRGRHASMSFLRPDDVSSSAQLIDPVSVPYQGMTIVVARLAGKKVDRLFYNVLNPQVDSPSDENDFSGWKEFLFPGTVLEPGDADYDSPPGWLGNPQVRIAGFDLVTVTKAATLPAPDDAAFAFVTDVPYLYCFRQTTRGTLMLNRLRLVEIPPALPERDASETPPPPDYILEPAWETRFQRSQKKDIPLDETDTLGSKNMEAKPFYEPTIELPAFTGISGGRFSAVLVPTSDPEQRRWVVATTSADSLVVRTVIERTGVFDYSEQAGSFTLRPGLEGVSGGSFTAAPAAALYYQQEPAGRNGNPNDTVRRAARIAVSVPFTVAGHNLDSAMAVYDFGLSPDGLPAAIPESTKAVLADGRLNEQGMFVPNDDPSYPVPPAAVHVVGKLTTTAVILGQLRCQTPPFLLASGDGLVHLYYHEGTAQTVGAFKVAQFATQVSRKESLVPWTTEDSSESGNVSFLARRPGPTLDGFTVTVAATPGSVGTCQVKINYGQASGIAGEEWTGVPRELKGFAAVLNGVASPDLADPQVRNGVIPYFDYSGTVAQARVKAVGEESFTVAHTRPDVVLGKVSVSPANRPAAIDMTTVFNSAGGPVTFLWAGLPTLDAAVLSILSGDAAPSEYSYEIDAASTTLVTLEVSAGTAPATIFLFAKPGKFPDGIVVKVVAATSGKSEECDLVAETSRANNEDNPLFRLKNIPREQSGFVAALKSAQETATLFFHISPPQTLGSVPNQTVHGPAGLRQAAALLATVQLRPSRTAAAIDSGEYQAVISQSHTVLSQTPKKGDRGMLAADAIVPRLPDGGQFGFIKVENASPLSTPAATAGAWLRRDRPIALALVQGGAGNAMKVPLVGPKRRRLAPGRRFTFETWVKPAKSEPSRIVSYRDDTLDRGLAAVRAEYQLGIDGQRNLNFGAYNSSQLSSYFQTERNPPDKNFLLTADFTWEVWVKPQEKPSPHGPLAMMMQLADSFNKIVPPLALGLNNDRVPTVTYRAADKSSKQLASASALPPNTWTHVAVTAHLSKGTWSIALLVNGAIVAQEAAVTFYSGSPVPFLVIGGQTATVIAALADLRYWNVWRSPAEIRSTMFVSLRDSTPGLQGYWPLSEDFATATVAVNRATATAKSWDATKQARTQPITSPRDDYFASLIGSVGGAPVLEVPAFLHVTHWNHVAVSFSAGGALHLNPAATFDQGRLDSVNCGNKASLDVGGSLAIDAWFAAGPSISAADQTLVSKWGIDPEQQSFRFGLTADGRLTCSLYLDGPPAAKRRMTTPPTNATYIDGQPYHVGCTFSSVSKPAQGAAAAEITWKVDLYVDGQRVGGAAETALQQDVPTVTIHPSSTDLLLGMRNPGPDPETPVPIVDQAYLRGTLGRTRMWRTVPPLAQMFPESAGLAPSTPSPETVLSEWDFTEGLGVIAADDAGGNDGHLSSNDLWGTLLSTSDVEFYANGNKIYQRSLHAAQGSLTGNQFVLGATLKGETVEAGLTGAFDETRLWDTVRTAQQLADNRFRPIESTELHLSAYWPFGVKGQPTTSDETGGMNDGVLIGSPAPIFETSTAPVSTEGPWVRDAYGGVATDFQVAVVGRIAASDYGSANPDSTGRLTGALKRLYGFADAFGLSLHAGFTIGSLDVVYIGQVQTAPQLIGFIEGAPPVPSENLSLPYYGSDTGRLKYLNNTLVTRSQVTRNSVTYTSSTGSQTQFALKTDGGLYLKASSSVGIGLSDKVFDNSLKSGPQISFSWSRGQDQQSGAGMNWSETWVDSLGLTGEWEPKRAKQSDYLSGYIGRRFIPDNVGYALVESLTADLFSLRLPRTGAMISSAVVPNIEYGPDRNIIIFPIKASYQKAGTLDGKVGLANDPAYGSSANLERKSYFNPAEAYEIRAAIATERAQRLTRFEQAKKSVREQFSNEGLSSGPSSFTGDDLDEAQQARMNRGIANTYVWTANGGLHTEQQEFGSVIESSASGLTSDAYNAGLKVTGEAALYKIGGYGNLDFLGGATIQSKSTAAGSDARTVSLTARVDGEPYLRTWNQDANEGKGGYEEGLAPGKVNAYRFITAYVPPSTDNSKLLIDKIMDDEWMRFSSDPNAVALRKANIEVNAAWRILHRVTYVSRVPPRLVSNPSETVPNSSLLPPVNLTGNVGLLDMVVPLLGEHPTAAEIGKAITAVMIPVNNQPSPFGALVPWWDAFVKAALEGKDEAQADLLYQIRLDALNYLIAGYVSGTISGRKRR